MAGNWKWTINLWTPHGEYKKPDIQVVSNEPAGLDNIETICADALAKAKVHGDFVWNISRCEVDQPGLDVAAVFPNHLNHFCNGEC